MTGIDWYAFNNCYKLTGVTIPNSLTELCPYAFCGCTSLTSITIPGSVTGISYDAFMGCTSLTSVTIGKGVTSIGSDAFYGCTSLANISIPDSVTSVYSEAFYNTAYYNNEENWENGVLYIDNCLIDAKDDLTGGYSIKAGTRVIASYAFERLYSLTSVTIPNSVTDIGSYAFWRCNSLTSVTIPNSVTSIGNYAFKDCTEIESLTCPDDVTVGTDAFYNCNSLQSVTLVNDSGSKLFTLKHNVLTISVKGEVTSEWRLFFDDARVAEVVIENGATAIVSNWYNNTFGNCVNLKKVTIPDSVTSIGDYAFSYYEQFDDISTGCGQLEDISIGNGVTEIGIDAFSNTAYYNNEANWENGVLYIGNYLIDAKEDLSGDYSIKAGTRVIADSAFYGCDSLTSITIPDGVTSIDSYVFFDCSSLESVSIGNGVKSIGRYAFKFCTLLTSIDIPDSVTEIGYGAFSCCGSLKSIVIPEGVTCIDNETFADCSSLESVTIPGTVSEIVGNGMMIDGGMEKSGAFAYCTSLKSITIPDGVKRVGALTFYNCSALESVTISNSVTNIDAWAFCGCESLADVYYSGTQEQWNAMEIDTMWGGNDSLINATIHYTGETHTHDYTDTVTAPTCTDKGYTTHTCSCGDSYVDTYVDALGHDTELKNAKSATCTEAGYTGDDVCKTCGETVKAGSAIAATGHDYKDGVCTVCGEKDSGYVPPHTHAYTDVVTAPTCTDKGYTTHTCACGGSYVDSYIDALGHSYKDGTCTVCGAADPDYKEPTPSVTFTDVADSAYYAKPVAWAVANNITGGYNDGTFRPMAICTRAQIVTFIWRANGSPEPLGTAKGFNDVAEGTYYCKAVLWAAEKGITGGFDDGGFHPDELVTRAQAMTFLWRAEGKPAVPEGTVNTFTDVPDTAYYHDAVLWAVANNITGGYNKATFGSMDGCTRAQIVTFLYRDMAE